MLPDWRFAAACPCGEGVLVSKSQAGSKLQCPKCREQFSAPSLSEVKRLPREDVSPIGRIERRIASGQGAFDGNCQLCKAYAGTYALPVQVAAYDLDSELSRSFLVPCVLCDSCAPEFKRGMWSGRFQSLAEACLKAIWLIVGFVFAAVFAFVLPFVGGVAVVAFMCGLFAYLTRRRANPFLRRHLNRICDFTESLDSADGYRTCVGKWQRLS